MTAKIWTPTAPQIELLPDGALIQMMRGRERVGRKIRLGPNMVHAYITRADGWIEDLGISPNLLTTAGRDLFAAAQGAPGINAGGSVAANTATAMSATSLTNTNAAYTTDIYKGWTVMVEEGTNTPVFGNISSNTGTVLTVDAWRNADDSAGTTPGATANYNIFPSARARYMGLTADAGAANAADTALTSEITTNGGGRALTTYAHTGGTATYTSAKTFTFTGTLTGIHKMGLLTGLTSGILVFESVLNIDMTVGNGDSGTVTDTVTLS